MQARSPERGGQEPLVSLVFPAYNPGRVIERTWGEVDRFLQTHANWEILFVCDGCTDGTTERLKKLTWAQAARVRVINYALNRGKGYAVRHGLALARGQFRIFTDIDLAYGFDDVVRVSQALRAGADVAIASRWHPESRLLIAPRLQGYVYRRHLQSLAFSALVRLLLPLTQRDTQAGLKGMNAAVARLIMPHLRCNGFEFDCELLTACVRAGLAIKEVPVCVRYEDSASTTNIISMGRMIRELLKIRDQWQPGRAIPRRDQPSELLPEGVGRQAA
jgi:glycosyltransferase involved in cell wall biosynthesis